LMEVASYLCPPAAAGPALFVAGASLSPMSGASPQLTRSRRTGRFKRLRLQSSNIPGSRPFRNSGQHRAKFICFREGGGVGLRDTCLAHWPQQFRERWDSKGSSSLHPVRYWRTRRSVHLPRRGFSGASLASLALAQASIA
jgi:hypothetical protein